MTQQEYDPVVRSMEIFGDRWTLLIVRDVFRGLRRFGQIQRSLGVARTVLSSRLALLVDNDILERHRYHQDPDWYEYHLTHRGVGLYPTIRELVRWADEYMPQ